MCDCKKEIEAKLLDRFKQQQPSAIEHKAELMGYAIGLSDTAMFLVGVMPIEFEANYPLKGGTLHKRKKTKQQMHFSFCPFCGAKYEKGEE